MQGFKGKIEVWMTADRLAEILLCALCLVPPVAGLTYRKNPENMALMLGQDIQTSLRHPYGNHWFGLISAVALPCLALAVFMLVRAAWRSRRIGLDKDALRQRRLILFLICMLCWSVGSWLLSSDHARSFFGTGYRHGGLLDYFYCAAFFVLATRLRRKQIRTVLKFFVGTACFLALLDLCYGAFLPTVWFHLSGSRNSHSSVFSNSNHYGYYICMALLSCTALMLSSVQRADKQQKQRLAAYLAAQALLGNSLALAGSAGPVFAVVGALMALTLLLLVREGAKSYRTRQVLVGDALVLVMLILPRANQFNLLYESISVVLMLCKMCGIATEGAPQLPGAKPYMDTGNGRLRLWKAALDFIRQKPWFGFGPDNLGESYLAMGISTDRPHNELLQFAASLGLPALGFYLAAMACHFWDFLQRIRQVDFLTIGLFTAVLGYGISSLAGNTMYYTSPYFFILLGLSWSALHRA